MIWKSLFFSFLLNKKTYRIKSLSSEKISEYINTINTMNLDIIKPYTLHTGLDCRHNITEQIDSELIYNISRFFYKQKLLKTLEDNTVSINTKLDYIYKYNSENNPSIYAPNIQAGGLWDEWTNVTI